MNISLSKFNRLFLLPIALVILLASCSKSDEPAPVNEHSRRTVLIYMVATNSLGTGRYDKNDIAEMQTAAKNGAFGNDCRLLIFHHSSDDRKQVLKEIKRDTGIIDTLKTYDSSLSSVSAARMEEVIADIKSMAPSSDYGLVLWSHANGWLVEIKTGENGSRNTTTYDNGIAMLSYGQDNSTGSTMHMNIDVLGNTLRGKGFSFIFFDCCYMACAEVFYDMAGTAPYIAASSAEIIAEGMPYQLTLPYLFSQGDADLTGAVKADYDYVNAKTDVYRTGTFTVADMSKVQALAQACREFYSFHPVIPDGFTPQRFMYSAPCYHYDLAHYVENLLPDGDTDAALFEEARARVLAAIDDMVIYKANTPYIWPGDMIAQIKVDHHCGLTTQFLRSASSAETRGYNTTTWWNDVARYLFE